MLLQLAAILRSTIRQNPHHGDVLLCKVRQHFVVEQVCCCDWRLRCIELDERYLAVGINKGLLINAAYAFHSAYVERVLGAKIARMGSFDFAAGDIVITLLL